MWKAGAKQKAIESKLDLTVTREECVLRQSDERSAIMDKLDENNRSLVKAFDALRKEVVELVAHIDERTRTVEQSVARIEGRLNGS